ncbi:hypothetical protein D3C79_483600 [compost metagenome]
MLGQYFKPSAAGSFDNAHIAVPFKRLPALDLQQGSASAVEACAEVAQPVERRFRDVRAIQVARRHRRRGKPGVLPNDNVRAHADCSSGEMTS